ncbi:hypothetical protein TSUD_73810 [Trifolium subterraneum]|uniref:Response regulatory domain-containing protein n=1 Tax=Trifolium subterraneum TaxID=3900 RepID=A0A2Z6LH10_TRISU|nr:hypothetical protein TSUD_73810 [Trifolium subterraneum]
MALSIKKELFPQQFSTNIRLLVIDHDINLLNAIQNACYKFHYSVMSCDGSRSAVVKAIEDGACDYWIKPFTENLMMNMWQHVARKIWNENKNLELEVEVDMKKGMIYDSKLPLIEPKIGVINTSVKQESVENNDDEPESSTKKTRVKWSSELNKKFIRAVVELNVDKFDFEANDASTSHVESKHIVYATPVNVYQTDDYEKETSPGFWTDSITTAQVQNIFLSCHQIPMTQKPLPMIIENPISSRGLSPFCTADTVGDIGGTNNSNGLLQKIKSNQSLESFYSCHSSWSAEDTKNVA